MDARWRKSTRSGTNGNCVEVRYAECMAQVRDSKDKTGPILSFSPDAWRAFVAFTKRS